MLLFQSGDNRHNAFGKATSSLALGAEAVLAPKYTGTDLPFTQIVGRFYAFDAYECPQGLLSFEDVAASACGFAVVASGTLTKQFAHFALNSLHLFLEGGATHSPISHLVPPSKHRVGLGQDGCTNELGFTIPVDEGLEVTKEVSPT